MNDYSKELLASPLVRKSHKEICESWGCAPTLEPDTFENAGDAAARVLSRLSTSNGEQA